MANKVVYVVEDKAGSQFTSYSGTKVYTRKHNACNLVNDYHKTLAVEYELVPTGRKYNKEGELVEGEV